MANIGVMNAKYGFQMAFIFIREDLFDQNSKIVPQIKLALINDEISGARPIKIDPA